jgi:hypothetical protein
MRLLTVSFFVCVLTAVVASPLNAKGRNVTIDKGDQKTTIACTGNAVTITSDDNEITLTGECSKLTVKGKDTNVTAATIKEVVVAGTDVNIIVSTSCGGMASAAGSRRFPRRRATTSTSFAAESRFLAIRA